MKNQTLSFPLFALLSVILIMVNTANNGGQPGGNCSGCHGNTTDPAGSLVLNDAPTTYVHGLSYPMTLCVTDPSKVAAGFTLNKNIGTLTNDDATSRIGSNGSATHDGKKFFDVNDQACWNITWTAPATGNTDLTFTYRGNAVNNNGNNGGDNGGYFETLSGISLPVEYVSIDVLQVDKGVEIRWTSATEINNDYYLIQKSRDAQRWIDIDKVEGAMNSQTSREYSVIDTDVTAGTIYYRIKQVDIDGQYDISETLSISYLTPDRKINVFPNPVIASQLETLQLSTPVVAYTLSSVNGELIQSYSGAEVKHIDIQSNVPAGLYYLKTQDQTILVSVL